MPTPVPPRLSGVLTPPRSRPGGAPRRRSHVATHRHRSTAGLGPGSGPAQAARPLRSPALGPSPPTEAERPIRPPPRPADPCPRTPEGAPGLLPPSLRFLRGQRSWPASGHGLAPLTSPRGLRACPGEGRRAGKTNRARARLGVGAAGAGRKCAVWPERRTKPAREPGHPAVTPGPPC